MANESSRRSARLTPYSLRSRQTASTEFIPSYLKSTSTVEELSSRAVNSTGSERQQVVESLVGRICQVHKVSPLWMFDCTARALQQYSQQLTGLLRALPPPIAGRKGQQRLNPYVGHVRIVEDFDPNGADAVVVSVKLRRATAPLAMVLLCRNIEPHKAEKGFSYYPLMLVHGPAAISQVVTDWIKASFDCCITTPQLHEELLHNFATKYATVLKKTGNKVGSLKLIYETPESVKKAGLNTISLEVPYDSVMSLDREDNLRKMLEEMIQTHIHLKLSSLTLTAIATPTLGLACSNSTIKCKCLVMDCVVPVLETIQQSWLTT